MLRDHVKKSRDEVSERCPTKIRTTNEDREQIHSANCWITWDASANKGPLTLEPGIFVQNHTNALFAPAALKTAAMLIRISNKSSAIRENTHVQKTNK